MPANVSGCSNVTLPTPLTAANVSYDPLYGNPDVFILFRVTPYLLSTTGALLVVILGIILTLIFPEDLSQQVYRRRRYWTVWVQKGESARLCN